MHFHRLQQRLMTFMEMMVVLAIISLIGGIAVVNINKAMYEQRFRTEVAAIVNQMRLAQNLMLILDQDVAVNFRSHGEKNIDYWLEMQCPAVKGWDKELTRRPPALTSVRVVEFDADEDESKKIEGELNLKFMSGGTVMSRGVLRLSTADESNKKNALERYVCLPGYPAPISALSGSVPSVSCLEELAGQFKDQITQITMQEITAKIDAQKSVVEEKEDPGKNDGTPVPQAIPENNPLLF